MVLCAISRSLLRRSRSAINCIIRQNRQRKNVGESTHMLLPLSESRFLRLDLLRELLPELLFLFLELGVVQLLDFGFAKLPCLHLLLTIVLVVKLLTCRDEVQHVCANQKGAKLLEIAMVLILDYARVISLSKKLV